MSVTSELRESARNGGSVGTATGRSRRVESVAAPWISMQSINVRRHAAALRPFTDGEFGTGAAAPSRAHVQAANQLFRGLRKVLLERADTVSEKSRDSIRHADRAAFEQLLVSKDLAHSQVRAIERVWDFYFELFGQRQTEFAPWLLACDRIALDCYQVAFMHTGTAKNIPAPAPFCYMRTGFAPATFRRAIPCDDSASCSTRFPWCSCHITVWSTRGRWVPSSTKSATISRTTSGWLGPFRAQWPTPC